MTKINFTKMHGAGNDYIYVYLPETPIADPAETSIRLSRQHFSIGSDGLILVDRSEKADFSMRIFNNDGSEAMMCGNGVRCVAKFVRDHGLTESDEVSVDTLSGVKTIRLQLQDGNVVGGTVDMGEPILANPHQMATPDGSMREGRIALSDGREWTGTFVSMGNPHFVIFVDDIESIDLPAVGPLLEHHPLFPERCNIEFAQLVAPDTLRTRVWERGSGITFACGTGACATATAAALTGRCGRRSAILMDGGRLDIEWREGDGHLLLTGPAETAFEGSVAL